MGEEYEPCHSLSVCVILVEYEPYSHSGSWLVSECDERVKRACDERAAPHPFLLLLFVAFCIFFCRCSQTFSAYLHKRGSVTDAGNPGSQFF